MTSELAFVRDAQRVAGWNDKRRETALRITQCARQLSADRGFDDFTLDELADCADVSRRTLFNYFDGKMEAVLGLPPAGTAAAIEQFVAGGPDGDLFADATYVARVVLTQKEVTRNDWATMHLAFDRNPKVLAAALLSFRMIGEDLIRLIEQREGTPAGDSRAVVTLSSLGALFEASVRTFIAPTNTRPLIDLFDSYVEAMRELIAPAV
ncbi:TetR family transcriptional regulator [Yimella sp. cx-573]|nr:TetR family transcriptional regulator [Yimella sp. cx-573]